MGSLELDKVLERAIQRVKKRWWRAALTNLLGFGILFLVGIVALVVATLVGFLFKTIFSLVLGIVFGVVVFFIFIIWAGSWVNLAYIKVVAEKEEIGPFKAFSETKSLAGAYALFNFLYIFFMLGLLPFFAIPFILWSIWGVLYPYTFLFEKEARGGLRPLWRSRELIKGNAWKVFFVMLLLFGISLLGGMLSISKSYTVSLIWYLFSFLFLAPFSVSLYYEIFEALRKGKEKVEAKQSSLSLALSFIGLLMFVVLFAAGFRAISRKSIFPLRTFMRQVEKNRLKRERRFKFDNFYKDKVYPGKYRRYGEL